MGCGGPPAPVFEYGDVKGKVTYKGEALKMGTVSFQPERGSPGVGEIGPDGTYSLKTITGVNKVKIVSEEAPKPPAGPDDPNRAKGGTAPPKKFIPDKFGTGEAGLTFTVKTGENKADWDLK